jgi:NAD(P)-dependent dehydrogenase (short-subunit alcohol dehydrogenase family)
MTPAEIARRAIIDAAVVLIEGEHDGIGDAVIDAFYAEGWQIVKGRKTVIAGHHCFVIEEAAR